MLRLKDMLMIMTINHDEVGDVGNGGDDDKIDSKNG